MSNAAIDALVECQDALVRALDARDIEAMLAASTALAKAVSDVRDAKVDLKDLHELQHAQKQSTALMIRVNTLTEWTRQRIDRLAELRGEGSPVTYQKRSMMATFPPIN